MSEPKRGTYREARPGEQLPEENVQIPMYITTAQREAFCRKIAAERARDITPKD